jgi:hypothetical protein
MPNSLTLSNRPRSVPVISVTAFFVVAMTATVIATPPSSALQAVDLLVQRVEFLLGQLAFVLGLLERTHDAFEIAENGFQAVPNAVDLAAQDTVKGTISFETTPAITVAAIISPFTSAIAVRFTAIITSPSDRAFAISFGALFVKFVGFMALFDGRFRRAFAFGSFVHSGRNILVFITRTVFAIWCFALTEIVFFARPRFFTIAGFFRRKIFAWPAIVTASTGAASAPRATASPRWRAAPASAPSATATIT